MPSVRYENHYYEPGTEFTIPGLGLMVNFEDMEKDEVAVATYLQLGYEMPENNTFVIKEAEAQSEDEEAAHPVVDAIGVAVETTPGTYVDQSEVVHPLLKKDDE